MGEHVDGYDEGGVLPSGAPMVNATQYPIAWLSPAQLNAYQAAAELVRRWETRDAQRGSQST